MITPLVPGAEGTIPYLMAASRREQAGELRALVEELRGSLEGEVRFDEGSRALYATDASNYGQTPLGVVVPRTTEDVVATVAACRRRGLPVLPRGGGTSLAGQCCNAAVVIDASKYLRGVLEIDPAHRRARVQPGAVLDHLRAAAVAHDLTFGPDPATHAYCTLGGMIGNNSCGPHSLMAGRTTDNIEELEILTYDGLRLQVGATTPAALERISAGGGRRGDIYRRLRALRDRHAAAIRARYPDIPRRVSGYNLDELLPERGFQVARALVGSEGTLVTVLEATLRLVPWPRHRTLLVVGYPDVFAAADRVPALLEDGPIALEGLDRRLIENLDRRQMLPEARRKLPEGDAYLLVEFGGDSAAEAEERARRAAAHLGERGAAVSARVFTDPHEQEAIWLIRESGLGATARAPGQPDTWPGWEDSAVAVEVLGRYLRALDRLFEKYGYPASLYGHFGQGCVHTRIPFELTTASGIARYRAFMNEATSLVVKLGGSLSGEHGDGQARAEFLGKMYGPELLGAFRELKAILDPDGKMNPGKVVDPYRIDENLRLGAGFRPAALRTHFRFPDDHGDFTRATLRCVGVGKCRRTDGGTMCPSYMVLREEEHTTRGRAHLLFEMTRSAPERRLPVWRSEAVKEALDLCLACKGCKGECPVGVDVATYKAEFLSHYYRGRLRPRAAYAMGLIDRWARLARLAPGVANLVSHARLTAPLFKRLAGLARERDVPQFAARTFRQQLRDRRRPARTAPRAAGPLVLWVDTFTEHFHPEVGLAALAFLEAQGHEVHVPAAPLCCGRPLYDSGMLRRARRYLRRVLDELREPLRAGVPVVGLEPSCVSVFRDELPNLMPDDEDARRLARQSRYFAELVDPAADGAGQWPGQHPLRGRALVHGHCHEKSLHGLDAERRTLERLGLEVEVLDSGCCGMAGSFGFEAGEKYAVSVAAGERRLLPAVRAAEESTLIVADGFSCREQIRQQTGRRALHVAEIACRGLGAEAVPDRERPARPGRVAAVVALGAGLSAAARIALAAWRVARGRRSARRSRHTRR